MTLKNLASFFIFMAFIAGSSAWAASSGTGDPSGSQQCKDELSKTHDRLEDMVNQSNNNNNVQTSSTNGDGSNGNSGGGSNPMAQMMQQMAQSQQAEAQLAQQQADKMQQIDNDAYNQMNQINDKIHDFQKGDYKRRMDIENASTELKKKQADIRIACQAKAEQQYNQQFGDLAKAAAAQQYAVSDMSRMSGTSSRMKGSLAVFKRRCLTNPATRDQLQEAQDEYDSKIHNFQIAAEEIQSDVSYTESKIGLLEGHVAQQKQQMMDQMAQQRQSLQQQMQMQMIGSALSMMTASSDNNTQQKTDKQFNSAYDTLQHWDDIYQKCRNFASDADAVPSDIFHMFSEVNDACRGTPTVQCVKSSNQESVRSPTGTTTN